MITDEMVEAAYSAFWEKYREAEDTPTKTAIRAAIEAADRASLGCNSLSFVNRSLISEILSFDPWRGIAEKLNNAFPWAETKEGDEYWAAVWRGLRRGVPLSDDARVRLNEILEADLRSSSPPDAK